MQDFKFDSRDEILRKRLHTNLNEKKQKKKQKKEAGHVVSKQRD